MWSQWITAGTNTHLTQTLEPIFFLAESCLINKKLKGFAISMGI